MELTHGVTRTVTTPIKKIRLSSIKKAGKSFGKRVIETASTETNQDGIHVRSDLQIKNMAEDHGCQDAKAFAIGINLTKDATLVVEEIYCVEGEPYHNGDEGTYKYTHWRANETSIILGAKGDEYFEKLGMKASESYERVADDAERIESAKRRLAMFKGTAKTVGNNEEEAQREVEEGLIDYSIVPEGETPAAKKTREKLLALQLEAAEDLN